jgi:propanol-preferring alcohol dehydrogenase
MRAMVLTRAGAALQPMDLPDPIAGPGQVVLRVLACGVCRTDLHVVDGELTDPVLPLVPGHEIVGVVEALGEGVDHLRLGRRVGVGWLGEACQTCPYCRTAHENLCDAPVFTGYTRNGGYATHTVADVRYAYPLSDDVDPADQAPLLCAGLIGWRSLVMAGEGRALGLYGFGAAAHLVAQAALYQGRDIYAFTRPGDHQGQAFAREIGAVWAGGSDEAPPVALDAAIIYAPVGALVPAALAAVRKGGTVVCAGIHMSDIPSFPYALLWGERRLVSVANLTRQDASDFLAVASRADIKAHVTRYPLAEANQALDDLRAGRLEGAAVLIP